MAFCPSFDILYAAATQMFGIFYPSLLYFSVRRVGEAKTSPQHAIFGG